MNIKSYQLFAVLIFFYSEGYGQAENFTAAYAEVDFGRHLRNWDGFGVNYVETSQTFDYEKYPQDYGGFRYLKPQDRDEIVRLVFANDGLKPGLVKMFLDPLHQQEENGPFDHARTTGSMRYFTSEGLRITRARGQDLSIVTTMYGPPGYITRQKMIRGRDLNPAKIEALANYLIDWSNYLINDQKLPLHYVSIHNEGESWLRFPQDGTLGETQEAGHDYNFFWDPQQVTEFVKYLRLRLDQAGLGQVEITNGEPTNWYRFAAWGFADAFYQDQAALKDLGLVTSHGFYVGRMEAARWFGPHTSRGIDLLREKKPMLHSWCTSTAWDVKNEDLIENNQKVRRYIMNATFAKEVHGNIYEAKVNGLIPWALIQNASNWNKPDPNPGSAFRVYDDGTWEVKKGYYYYKQMSRAGQPGMAVVNTTVMDSEIAIIGFDNNNTRNPDAFVLVNYGTNDREIQVNLLDNQAKSFQAFRTSGSEVYEAYETARSKYPEGENYKSLGNYVVKGQRILYQAPANSVTTFFAN